MIRKLATVGRVIGVAALLAAPLSVGGVALAGDTGTSTSQSGKDCSTLDKSTKAYRDCMAATKGSGGNTSGGSTRTTPGH
jgi:hypothetical protein